MLEAAIWQVVGGSDTGGLVVRKGRALDSELAPQRLAYGARVREEERSGNRLCYHRLSGSGPDVGWVSLSLRDKPLLVEWKAPAAAEAPAPPLPPPPVAVPRSKRPAPHGPGRPEPEAAVNPAVSDERKRARVARLLGALKQHVADCLERRANLEREVDRNVRDAESAQRAQAAQEITLSKVLEELRLAADEADPAPKPLPRSLLRCASECCGFRVHWRSVLGGYCCVPCSKGHGHGPRCERAKAVFAAERAKPVKPCPPEELAQIELQEAIWLYELHRGSGARPPPGPENSALVNESKWSRSGREAIGKWVSSIANDNYGTPDTAGPVQLLEGSFWISRRTKTSNQWIVFDLGSEQLVSEVRVRGNFQNTRFNAKSMLWEKATELAGPWETLVQLDGRKDRDWTSVPLEPPVRLRWGRLFIKSNWGSPDYVWICGFFLRIISERSFDEEFREQRERRARSGGNGDAGGASEKAGEQKPRNDGHNESDVHKTLDDLRKHDVDWQQPHGYQKLQIRSLLWDRVVAFEDKLYIDYQRQNPTEYAKAYLQQPQEMGWSLDFHPNLFCELAYEGFNPTSIEFPSDNDLMIQVLTPCFEPERNVFRCVDAHVSKKVRKRAKQYTMTIDTAYDEVMLEVIRQHGEGWLWRGERWVLRKLRQEGYRGQEKIKFAARSFELWDRNGTLVAGDLGYTLGGVYVSQTGFHKAGTCGAGEVQLVLTAALLHKMGHSWFDLGQARTYKDALGAVRLGRADWLERFRAVRDNDCVFSHEPIAGDELLGHLLHAMAMEKGEALTMVKAVAVVEPGAPSWTPTGASPVEAAPLEEASPAEAAPLESAAHILAAEVETSPAEAAPLESAAHILAAEVEASPAEAAPLESAAHVPAEEEASPAEAAPLESAAHVLAAEVEASPAEAAPLESAAYLIAEAEAPPAEAAPLESSAHLIAEVEASPAEAAPLESASHVPAAEGEASPLESAAHVLAELEASPLEAAPLESASHALAELEASPAEAAPLESAAHEPAADVEAPPAEAAPLESAAHALAELEAPPAEAAPLESAAHALAELEAPPAEAAPLESAAHMPAEVEASPAEAAPLESAVHVPAEVEASPAEPVWPWTQQEVPVLVPEQASEASVPEEEVWPWMQQEVPVQVPEQASEASVAEKEVWPWTQQEVPVQVPEQANEASFAEEEAWPFPWVSVPAEARQEAPESEEASAARQEVQAQDGWAASVVKAPPASLPEVPTDVLEEAAPEAPAEPLPEVPTEVLVEALETPVERLEEGCEERFTATQEAELQALRSLLRQREEQLVSFAQSLAELTCEESSETLREGLARLAAKVADATKTLVLLPQSEQGSQEGSSLADLMHQKAVGATEFFPLSPRSEHGNEEADPQFEAAGLMPEKASGVTEFFALSSRSESEASCAAVATVPGQVVAQADREAAEHAVAAIAEDAVAASAKPRCVLLDLALQLTPVHADQEAWGGPIWIVVGGAQVGGLVVRASEDLKSPAYAERLCTGTAVEELASTGKRLCYRRLRGNGPDTGWISMDFNGRRLVEALAAELWEQVLTAHHAPSAQ